MAENLLTIVDQIFIFSVDRHSILDNVGWSVRYTVTGTNLKAENRF